MNVNECKRLQILHYMFLYSAQIGPYSVNLATFRKACTASTSTCNSTAINISRKRTVSFFEYVNGIIHLPINPLGLIVKGLYFSCDNVFFQSSVLIGYFTVVSLVTWPLSGSEAGVDLVLVQTLLLFMCKYKLVSMRTT